MRRHLDRKIKCIPPTSRGESKKLTMTSHIELPNYQNDDHHKIAIIQTGSWGDNINSTLMLQPLKQKYPDCIIDVYTSTLYHSAFVNNPYIHRLIQYPATQKNEALHLTLLIPDYIKNVGYNTVLAPHPMFNHGNWTSVKNPQLGTNLICAWVRAIEDLNADYTLPLETILRLTPTETSNVASFLSKIPNRKKNILMEVHGESGQTHWTPEWTVRVGKYLTQKDYNLFISRSFDSGDIDELRRFAPGRVYFAGKLSIRECAELFNHCDAFLSVSSGLSNACNTNWCKKTGQWFEVTNSPAATSSVIRSENKIFYHDNNLDGYISLLHDHGL